MNNLNIALKYCNFIIKHKAMKKIIIILMLISLGCTKEETINVNIEPSFKIECDETYEDYTFQKKIFKIYHNPDVINTKLTYGAVVEIRFYNNVTNRPIGLFYTKSGGPFFNMWILIEPDQYNGHTFNFLHFKQDIEDECTLFINGTLTAYNGSEVLAEKEVRQEIYFYNGH